MEPYFIPFTTEARGCIGRNISYLELILVIATLFIDMSLRCRVQTGSFSATRLSTNWWESFRSSFGVGSFCEFRGSRLESSQLFAFISDVLAIRPLGLRITLDGLSNESCFNTHFVYSIRVF